MTTREEAKRALEQAAALLRPFLEQKVPPADSDLAKCDYITAAAEVGDVIEGLGFARDALDVELDEDGQPDSGVIESRSR